MQGFMHMPDQQHLMQPMNGGTVGGVQDMPPGTSEPLQLTQLLGSEADQQVLLTQPKAHIIARAKMPRGDRLVSRQSLLESFHHSLAGGVGWWYHALQRSTCV